MSLLWEAFKTLTRPELRDLERVVRSPFFNRKEQLVRLFDHLCVCLEKKQPPIPEEAFRAAHPGQTYDVGKLRLAYSDLLAVIEQYWVVRRNLDDTPSFKAQLTTAYRLRNLPKHRQSALREARSAAEQAVWRNAEHLIATNSLDMEEYQGAAVNKRDAALNLQTIFEHSDAAFIAQKMRYVCAALSHQAVFKMEYRFGLLEALYAHVETSNLLDTPAIALYYHAAHFLANPAEEGHFERFNALLGQHANLFPPDEQRALYLLAINFGVKKCNTGRLEWFHATFQLYRGALDRNLLLTNGALSRFSYNNITIIGEKVGEITWVENFLHQYKPLLDRAWRESSFCSNMARLEYRRKRYKEALHYLQGADYKDFINSMNAKVLQVKIYYDTKETAALESHLDSMQRYIQRHRAVGYHRDNYLNIVHFTRALLRLGPNPSPADLAALRHQIEQTAALTEREWLLEQVDL